MAKRRKLSDLVKEEIQRPEVTDLQTLEVRESRIDEAANLQTPEVRDLRDDRVTGSQRAEVTGVQAVELPNPLPTKETDLQTTRTTNLQSLEDAELQSNEVTDLQATKIQTSVSARDGKRAAPVGKVTELQIPDETDSQASKQQTAKLTDSRSSASHRDRERASAPVEQVPKYLTLIRKETRLREDQLDRLTAIARKLNRTKRGGERITENTLIRVAVDLLLARATSLSGVTEAELRDSLGWEETD